MTGRLVHVELDVLVDAPAEAVFAAFTQWAEQGRWMVGTAVEVTEGDGRSVGSVLAAFTGLGAGGRGPRIGFLDTMVITRWEAPLRVDVLHTGAVVRGTGTMEVVRLPGGRSRFIWSEDLDLPLGALGRLGWPFARPAFLAGVRRSLEAFGRLVERGELPVPAPAVA